MRDVFVEAMKKSKQTKILEQKANVFFNLQYLCGYKNNVPYPVRNFKASEIYTVLCKNIISDDRGMNYSEVIILVARWRDSRCITG